MKHNTCIHVERGCMCCLINLVHVFSCSLIPLSKNFVMLTSSDKPLRLLAWFWDFSWVALSHFPFLAFLIEIKASVNWVFLDRFKVRTTFGVRLFWFWHMLTNILTADGVVYPSSVRRVSVIIVLLAYIWLIPDTWVIVSELANRNIDWFLVVGNCRWFRLSPTLVFSVMVH